MAQRAQEVWTPQSVGERIGLIRRRQGLSQTELARRVSALGVQLHNSTLAQFESGRRRPSLEHLWAIAKVLGVKIGDLGATEEDYPGLAFLRDPEMLKHTTG